MSFLGLSPCVNFINVLHTTFMLVDPKSKKIQLSHKYLSTLSGSASVKAVRRTLMKLSPGLNLVVHYSDSFENRDQFLLLKSTTVKKRNEPPT